MLICKIFSGDDSYKVEEQINTFLEKNQHITIHSICQSSDSQRMVISIYFNVKTQSALAQAQPVRQVETVVAKAEVVKAEAGR